MTSSSSSLRAVLAWVYPILTSMRWTCHRLCAQQEIDCRMDRLPSVGPPSGAYTLLPNVTPSACTLKVSSVVFFVYSTVNFNIFASDHMNLLKNVRHGVIAPVSGRLHQGLRHGHHSFCCVMFHVIVRIWQGLRFRSSWSWYSYDVTPSAPCWRL